MTFQSVVNRNFTTGTAGKVVRDGPIRAKPGRITSATIGTDPAQSTNRISRAFGYSGASAATGVTYAAEVPTVAVGGPIFYGVLFHPESYELNGTVQGGPLAASFDLPHGSLGQFADMAILIAELFNETTASKPMSYGDQVAFAPNTITVGENAQAIPYGGLISVAEGAAAPTGFVLIPNARIINPVTIAASAAGAPVSGLTIIQLTQ